MSNNIKDEILQEIQNRIHKLESHENDKIKLSDNQYEELNQAIAKIIRVALHGELVGLQDYIKEL